MLLPWKSKNCLERFSLRLYMSQAIVGNIEILLDVVEPINLESLTAATFYFYDLSSMIRSDIYS